LAPIVLLEKKHKKLKPKVDQLARTYQKVDEKEETSRGMKHSIFDPVLFQKLYKQEKFLKQKMPPE
jgi:hypothetical protein